MKKLILSAVVALSFAVPAVALACEGHNETAAATQKPTVKQVTVDELATIQKAKKAAIYDANQPDFRVKNGVIPDAKLLSSAVKYDAAKELPQAKDSKLVFYCANEKCSASKTAAERAIEAGYVDVNILPVGLQGWKSAGKPTNKIPQS